MDLTIKNKKMPYNYHTSLPAYQENKQGKDYCRMQVFIAIRKLQPCTDKQISEYLNWPINRTVPRRNELVAKTMVVLAKRDRDPETGRLVSYWQVKSVTHQPVLF